MEKSLGQSAYYSQKQDMLYVLSDGTLRKINVADTTSFMLVEELKKGQYVSSDDGHLFAYQKNVDGNIVAEVWDFAKDNRKKVSAGAGFIVVLTGDILTMPGLPKVPAAERIDVDENGKITGLF